MVYPNNLILLPLDSDDDDLRYHEEIRVEFQDLVEILFKAMDPIEIV